MDTPTENQSMTTAERPKGKLYTGALPPTIKLAEEGDNFIGEFLSRTETDIKGSSVWVYKFRNDLGEVCALLGKHHLDRTWEDIKTDHPDGLEGRRIYIERMKSVEIASSGRTMAEYDVVLAEDE